MIWRTSEVAGPGARARRAHGGSPRRPLTTSASVQGHGGIRIRRVTCRALSNQATTVAWSTTVAPIPVRAQVAGRSADNREWDASAETDEPQPRRASSMACPPGDAMSTWTVRRTDPGRRAGRDARGCAGAGSSRRLQVGSALRYLSRSPNGPSLAPGLTTPEMPEK